MRTALAHAQPAPIPETTQHPLRAVEVAPTRQQRRARPRTVYAVTTMVGVVAILAAQLLASIMLSEGAYEISELQSQRKTLDREAEGLTERLDVLSSPQQLAVSAQALGMRPASTPAFLDLSNGAVLGAPAAVRDQPAVAGGGLVANSLLTGATIGEAPITETPVTPQPGGWIVADGTDAPTAGEPSTPAASGSVASAPNSLPTPTTR